MVRLLDSATVDLLSILAVAAGYLIGSIDFGVIVPRLQGVDIYRLGSGNPGTSNVLRSLGRKSAALVLLGDLLKGLVAAMIGDLVGTDAVGFAAGFAAVAGHCFPLWHRFKGGKGVAAAGGMLLWMEPLFGLLMIALWGGLVALTKRASIASLALAVVCVPGLMAFGYRGWSLVWAGAAALLVLGRHWKNIRRLASGGEHTIGEKAA
jgi:glycerol-3-phosphate acyltransferase PlsY